MTNATPGSAPAGRPEKRAAIVAAAMAVFGREGYARASMDAIAAQAGVSKRTVYNHFSDKETLFLSVALETSGALTERIGELAARRLDDVTDLRADLIAFAADRAREVVGAGDHAALGRAIRAEAGNIPPEALRAWEEAGVVAALRDQEVRLRRLADEGHLVVEDAGLAAEHFMLLTFHGVADRSYWGTFPIDDAEIVRIATTGVDAFLKIYGAAAG
ncbi:TetR/AcrR family transcriptional regulator [Kitasatospora sp. NA04385]|uniref:TetR/AcrR family transcriptional regulator n=1 Tax=Kitasatospora sp. NA04385 TaxID=2742135 RepID=UPI0015921AA8|nr:TetR/AcrR family transcriptional regulator [Kitasatospora sp. NA04385]QKW20910.1 TetR/AcrR family transcriptional regulator [Kitasatospora sp. NA04385]